MAYIVEIESKHYSQDRLLELWQEAFPFYDQRRISWSYQDNPCGKATVFWLKTTSRQEYIGACAALPKIYWAGDKEITVGVLADYALKKKYRSLGPALNLSKAIMESSVQDLCLGLPNVKMLPVKQRSGYFTLGEMHNYLIIFRSNEFVRSMVEKFLKFPLNAIFHLFLRFNRAVSYLKYLDTKYTSKHGDLVFGPEFDRLWDGAKHNFGFVGKRNAKYLNWRFADNPYQQYLLFKMYNSKSDQFIGYIIYYIKSGIAYIEDCLSIDNKKSLRILIKSFIKYSYKAKYDGINFQVLSSAKIGSELKKGGLYEYKGKPQAVLGTISVDFGSIGCYKITAGDFDI